MRISEACIYAVVIGAGLGLPPVLAFDGTHGSAPAPMLTLDAPAVPGPPPSMGFDPSVRGTVPTAPGGGLEPLRGAVPPPDDGFRCGIRSARGGDKPKALSALQYAAEQGHPAAQWQLGSMFARGDGVPRDDLKAFEYFSRIADDHADEAPAGPQARIAASAFVALGCYYLEGIPNTRVRRDPDEARSRFFYAASYFGDADAQYHLARMMLDGAGGPRTPQQAVKWLGLTATKGNYPAQALLGRILFEGSLVRRQGARGLMWLSLARDSASPDEAWIVDQWESAFKQANDDERAMALRYIEEWLQGRRK